MREQILEAAFRCIADHGLAHTRIRHIARRARISEGTIFNYFKSKEHLLETLLEWVNSRYIENIKTIRDSRQNGEQMLEALFEYQKVLNSEQKAIQQVFYDYLIQATWQRSLSPKVVEQYRVFRDFIKGILAKKMKKRISDERASLLAAFVASALEGASLQLITDPRAFNLDEYLGLVRQIVNLLCNIGETME